MRRQSMLGLWCLLAACTGPTYVPADTSDPDREVTCTGTIIAFASLPGGDFELRVTPRPEDAHLLTKGQTDILCTIPANRRDPYTKILPRLKVGSPVAVSGYWVTATATGHNEVRSVTSLDAFPDRR